MRGTGGWFQRCGRGRFLGLPAIYRNTYSRVGRLINSPYSSPGAGGTHGDSGEGHIEEVLKVGLWRVAGFLGIHSVIDFVVNFMVY